MMCFPNGVYRVVMCISVPRGVTPLCQLTWPSTSHQANVLCRGGLTRMLGGAYAGAIQLTPLVLGLRDYFSVFIRHGKLYNFISI